MYINVIAPWNSLGYGQAAKNIITHLDKNSHEVAYFPISNNIEMELESEREILDRTISNSAFFKTDVPCLLIWHQFAMERTIVKASQHIGFPIFELDTFNEREKHHLKSLDKIFVCSKWAKTIIEQNKIRVPTFVVPLGVDRTIFQPSSQKSKSTVFFTCGKLEVRKSHDVIIDCFNAAFELNDNVLLQMMVSNPFVSQEEFNSWVNYAKSTKMGDKIEFIPRVKTQLDVRNIMAKADCGLFLSRAEGFNLEYLEALSCGLTCIGTNYSAHTEYANNDNSLLIDVDEVESAYDGRWFFNNGNWASINSKQIEQIITYMRYIYKLKLNNKLNINNNGIATAKLFSWLNTINKLVEYIHV